MGTIIIHCGCGQKNRATVGTVARCGSCRALLPGLDAPDTFSKRSAYLFGERLATAARRERFGRMHFPADYPRCPTCGVDHHKNDRCK